MKVRESRVVDHVGNLEPLEIVDASVDLSNLGAIIKPLTQLYSDGIMATIRETSTNAWDSHVAARNWVPIEIETPSELRPEFVVRDHGLGLSYDEIVTNYLKYGHSTKRDTNEAVGMLGFGCKAPLSYTNQFTITAVKNGIRTTAVILEGEKGLPQMRVLDTSSTDEANGVELRIPVAAPIEQFNKKVLHFFRFWEPGTVLVNGDIPKSYFESGDPDNLELDEDILIDKKSQQSYVVMGNVPYPCTIDHGLRGAAVIARVQIGDVDFVPSREALKMEDEKTRDTLAEITKYVRERLAVKVQEDIESQPTRKDALKEALRWDQLLYSYKRRPEWRGEKLESYFPISGQEWSCGYYRGSASKSAGIQASKMLEDNTYVLVGHPKCSMSKETKEHLKKLYPDATTFYIVWSMPRATKLWVEDCAQVVKWEDAKPPRPFGSGPGVRAKRDSKYRDGGGRWLCWQPDGKFVTEDLPTEQEEPDLLIMWLLKSESSQWGTRDSTRSRLADYLKKQERPWKLVVLSSAEKDRFLKLHPHAVHFKGYFQPRAEFLLSELSADQRWLGYNHANRRHWFFGMFDTSTKFDDPEVQEIVDRYRAALDADPLNIELEFICRNSGQLGGSGTIILDSKKDHRGNQIDNFRNTITCDLEKALIKFEKNYPLAEGNYRQKEFKAQIVEYVNAVHAYRNNRRSK